MHKYNDLSKPVEKHMDIYLIKVKDYHNVILATKEIDYVDFKTNKPSYCYLVERADGEVYKYNESRVTFVLKLQEINVQCDNKTNQISIIQKENKND